MDSHDSVAVTFFLNLIKSMLMQECKTTLDYKYICCRETLNVLFFITFRYGMNYCQSFINARIKIFL